MVKDLHCKLLGTMHANPEVQLKKSCKWFHKVQFQLGITKLDKCDLVILIKCSIKINNNPFEDTIHGNEEVQVKR